MASENEERIIEVDARPKKAAMRKGVSFSDSQQEHTIDNAGKVHSL